MADYDSVIEKVFFAHYKKGSKAVEFERQELLDTAASLGITIKNIGDTIYSYRFRKTLPSRILATQTKDMEWVIQLGGRGKYEFRLLRVNRITPNPDLVTIKVPDATPEIIAVYALTDEQALLAKIRYNRLVDIFTGVTVYSLQNHLRTTVKGVGQIEIDEVYVGLDRHGSQYVFPVQAKGGNDQLAVVQTKQDIACCAERFSRLVCRPLSAQFMADGQIALFELTLEGDEVKVVEERHYRLTPAEQITDADLQSYGQRKRPA